MMGKTFYILRGLFTALGVLAALTSCGRTPPDSKPEPAPSPISTTSSEPTPAPVPTLEQIPTPEPTPTPYPYVPRKNVDVARFYNGITIESELTLDSEGETPAVDRLRMDSYVLEMNLRIRMPRAATTLEDFQRNDPKFVKHFPALESLLANATVSPAFARLYQNKIDYIRPRLSRLEEILSRHNFYDCDTILEITAPGTGEPVLLIAADMDLNVDGSDGDRNMPVDGSSAFFVPQTSYRWRKLTERPNPFLEPTRKRLAQVEAELKSKELDPEKRREFEATKRLLTKRILEMRTWSFLISDADPFIVLPGFMFRDKGERFTPSFGDYAIVAHDGKFYPAIVGDAGPSFKIGEASMRLCREINPKTSAARRAASNLRVFYFVFPGSGAKDPPAPPDFELWHERCSALFAAIGGDPALLHRWENIVPEWPTPTPTPTPTPMVTPSPSPSPSSSPPPPEPSPGATPEPVSSPAGGLSDALPRGS